MNNQSYYPGMLNSEIEFFFEGSQTMYMTNGIIKPFSAITSCIEKTLTAELNKDEEALEILSKMFPNEPLKQLEKFTKCRFGGLDFSADINHAGKIQKGEYWDCPLRGNCKAEGKLCKHIKYNNNIIDSAEIALIKLLVTDMTNEAIASELSIPLGTVHYKKRVLYEKIEIKTKQELTLFAVRFNLAQPII
ncbi:helix-turn-helix transcriptional regulator [Faecalibacter sp. LW9]|uniref:helix-turn-helix transcriptional regulator n=1 Tax=Faecalibacter sp. LW9 TaxID=3103144 RepID=UPI002AFEDAB6|nr:LuxR C-terminal-related transcriptional regulator [Faecalibacter sp. LW9]